MTLRKKEKKANFDVIVVGGGLSGMCAAIAAARQGSKTALVHARSVLGGNASSEIRMHVCGASSNGMKKNVEETGILNEIMLENKAINDNFNYSIWDAVLFRAVKKEKNLTVFLNTSFYDVECVDNSIVGISCYQQTTEIEWHLTARIFVDATGNGTLGWMAGAEFRIGSEGKSEFNEKHAPDQPDNNRMGNTLLFKAVDKGHPVEFKTPEWAFHFTEEQLKYRIHSNKTSINNISYGAGTESSDKMEKSFDESFFNFGVDYGYWWIELPGTSEDIISEYEEIRDELVGCVWGIWDHIKNGGDHGAENYELEWVGMLPGVRESRRLVGDYLINENDLLSGRVFPDAVAYGGWPIDVHTPGGLYAFGKKPLSIWEIDGIYTIPYRSYYSKNISNLMMAGRNISATKLAMASTRVMGTCAIGGQAVGVAAAMCIKYSCNPRDINGHIDELQQILIKDDCYIPGFKNTDPADLARKATIKATSETEGNQASNVINGVSRTVGDDSNVWESDGLSPNGETLTLEFDTAVVASQLRLTFDQNLSRPIKITLSEKRRREQIPGVPPELIRDYDVIFYLGESVVYKTEMRNNHQRQNVIDFDPVECDKIDIVIKSTNGCNNARVFEIRLY